MRAATFLAPGKIDITTCPVPEPLADEVLVRLEGCGVGTPDLSAWEGHPLYDYPLPPGQPGHEGWGVITSVGSEVRDMAPGDRVTLFSRHAYAEYDVAPASTVVRLPPALDNQPFPGTSLASAASIFRRCEIKHGQTVAIVGIGFLGALLTQLVAGAGARVIAVTRRRYGLDTARIFGAAELVIMERDNEDTIEQVHDLSGGKGCDCVIEATGKQGPLNLAAELVREQGRLVIAGYHFDGMRQVNLQLWNALGLEVVNAHQRDPKHLSAGAQAAADAIVSGKLDPAPLYTHHYSLEQLALALETAASRPDGFMKAMIVL
jgi:2-desacetyl-2-hydroxyethyl bacteriochlorophyllide A dehydrogenase